MQGVHGKSKNMGTVITNLKAKFGVDTADFITGLSNSEKALVNFDKKIGSAITGLSKMLTPMALIGGVGGALAVLKSSIESVEGPGDRFEAVIGGGKEALFEMQRALGTMDFSHLFRNLKEGFERGKVFAEALDALADRAAYNDYKIAELNRESSSLKEIIKNKTLEISVRADAGKKVLEIEEKIVKRKIDLAKEEFRLAKDQWQGRNKMEVDEALKLYETIDNMKPEYKNVLGEQFARAMKIQYGDVGRAIKMIQNDAVDGFLKMQVPESAIKSYTEYFRLVESGEKDVLQKLFKTFKDINKVTYEAQEQYNGAVASTTKLLAAEEKQADKSLKTHEKTFEVLKQEAALREAKAAQVAIPVADISNIKLPDFSLASSQLAQFRKTVTDVSLDISKELTSAFEDLSLGLGEFLGKLVTGEAGLKDFGSVMIGAFAGLAVTVGKLIIQMALAKAGIEKAIMIPYAWPIALAAGIALVALGSALSNSMSSSSAGSAGGISGSSGSTGGNEFFYDTRNAVKPAPITINGRLVAEGKDLVYVFNLENNRKNITT